MPFDVVRDQRRIGLHRGHLPFQPDRMGPAVRIAERDVVAGWRTSRPALGVDSRITRIRGFEAAARSHIRRRRPPGSS
jgi:hypothetical protein